MSPHVVVPDSLLLVGATQIHDWISDCVQFLLKDSGSRDHKLKNRLATAVIPAEGAPGRTLLLGLLALCTNMSSYQRLEVGYMDASSLQPLPEQLDIPAGSCGTVEETATRAFLPRLAALFHETFRVCGCSFDSDEDLIHRCAAALCALPGIQPRKLLLVDNLPGELVPVWLKLSSEINSLQGLSAPLVIISCSSDTKAQDLVEKLFWESSCAQERTLLLRPLVGEQSSQELSAQCWLDIWRLLEVPERLCQTEVAHMFLEHVPQAGAIGILQMASFLRTCPTVFGARELKFLLQGYTEDNGLMQLDLTRFIPFLLLLDSVVDSLELLILCFLRVLPPWVEVDASLIVSLLTSKNVEDVTMEKAEASLDHLVSLQLLERRGCRPRLCASGTLETSATASQSSCSSASPSASPSGRVSSSPASTTAPARPASGDNNVKAVHVEASSSKGPGFFDCSLHDFPDGQDSSRSRFSIVPNRGAVEMAPVFGVNTHIAAALAVAFERDCVTSKTQDRFPHVPASDASAQLVIILLESLLPICNAFAEGDASQRDEASSRFCAHLGLWDWMLRQLSCTPLKPTSPIFQAALDPFFPLHRLDLTLLLEFLPVDVLQFHLTPLLDALIQEGKNSNWMMLGGTKQSCLLQLMWKRAQLLLLNERLRKTLTVDGPALSELRLIFRSAQKQHPDASVPVCTAHLNLAYGLMQVAQHGAGSGGSGLLEEACKLLLDAGKFAAEFIQKNNIRRHPLQLEIAHNLHQAQVLLQRYSPTTQGSPSEPSVWESMRIIDEDFVKTRTADQLRKLPCFMLEACVQLCYRLWQSGHHTLSDSMIAPLLDAILPLSSLEEYSVGLHSDQGSSPRIFLPSFETLMLVADLAEDMAMSKCSRMDPRQHALRSLVLQSQLAFRIQSCLPPTHPVHLTSSVQLSHMCADCGDFAGAVSWMRYAEGRASQQNSESLSGAEERDSTLLFALEEMAAELSGDYNGALQAILQHSFPTGASASLDEVQDQICKLLLSSGTDVLVEVPPVFLAWGISSLRGRRRHDEALFAGRNVMHLLDDALGRMTPSRHSFLTRSSLQRHRIDIIKMLGQAAEAAKNFKMAAQLYDKLVVVYTDLYGRIHPKTAHALVVLAGVQLAQDRVEVGRKSLMEALKIQEQVLQGNVGHPEYLSLANVVFETFRSHRDCLADALHVYEELLGKLDSNSDIRPRIEALYEGTKSLVS